MSPISVRGLAVASASAVTAVGSVVGAASPGTTHTNDAEATAADSTLLADLPAGQQAQVQTASLTQQADAQAVQADASARKDAEQAARKAAAETAVAKKEAAQKAAAEKAAKEQTEAKSAAGHSSTVVPAKSSYTVAEIQAIARQIVPSGQFQCFSNIVDRESGWNMQALNASSGAYGLMQALPGYKYAAAGSDWRTNPATQIKWGLNYMNSTYGSPCQAWSFWQTHHAY